MKLAELQKERVDSLASTSSSLRAVGSELIPEIAGIFLSAPGARSTLTPTVPSIKMITEVKWSGREADP